MILRWVVKHRIPIPDIANSKMKMFYTVLKIFILRIVYKTLNSCSLKAYSRLRGKRK